MERRCSLKTYSLIALVTLATAPLAYSASLCSDVFSGTRLESSGPHHLHDILVNDFYYEPSAGEMSLLREAMNPDGKRSFQVREDFQTLLRSVYFDLPTLTRRVRKELGRALSEEEAVALRVALAIGRSDYGKAGNFLYSRGRYTPEQIAQKDRVLDLAGFSIDERMMIILNQSVEEHLTAQAPFNMFTIPRPASADQAKQINSTIIAEMNQIAPKTNDLIRGRKAGMTKRERRKLYETITRHPVARLMNVLKYDKERNIGYCFGRATVGHIEALRAGLSKDSIRKVFAVGKMKAVGSEKFWQYHVALAVRNAEGGWSVIDPFIGKSVSLEEWTEHFNGKDPEGRTRIFMTEPTRLFPNSFYKYNKEEFDSFPDYFGDVFKYYREISRNPELEKRSIFVRVMNRFLSLVRLGI